MNTTQPFQGGLFDAPPRHRKRAPRGKTGLCKASTMQVIAENQGRFRDEFAEFVGSNWHIWTDFYARAMAVSRVRDHYSARRIVESMRHDSAIRQTGGEWKINGNIVPDLARLFHLVRPELGRLFETRASEKRRTA